MRLFDFTITGSNRAMDALRRFAARAENFEEVGPEVHDFLLRRHTKLFATQGASHRVPWASLRSREPKYAKYKEAILGEKLGRQALTWAPGQEVLRPSVTEKSHPLHVWRTDSKQFTFGTKVPYSRRHQKGQGEGPFDEPVQERPHVVVVDRDVAEIRRIISRFIGI